MIQAIDWLTGIPVKDNVHRLHLNPDSSFQPRVYSGFPGCKRTEGSTVSSILSTLSSIVLVLQLVFNISNANNNENKKNENNQNNNNNNNVQTYDNIIVSMNENMSSETMMMMLGRQLKSGWISWKPLVAKMLKQLVAGEEDQLHGILLTELAAVLIEPT